MAKLRTLVLGAVLIGGSGYVMKACVAKRSAPDAKVAAQFEKICGIAHRNVETPERGVRELGRFLSAHLGDLTGGYGDTIALIESIPDDAAHDARAHEARDTMFRPLRTCQGDLVEFLQAVSQDEASNELIERAGTRLQRTMDIIFGQGESLLDAAGHLDVPAVERRLHAI